MKKVSKNNIKLYENIMTLTPFEIYAIMTWTNLELQRKIDSPSQEGIIDISGEYLSQQRLVKMCKKELSRRKNVGLYIEEANEWDRFTPSPEDYDEDEDEELSIEERNQLIVKQLRKTPRRSSTLSLLNIGVHKKS